MANSSVICKLLNEKLEKKGANIVLIQLEEKRKKILQFDFSRENDFSDGYFETYSEQNTEIRKLLVIVDHTRNNVDNPMSTKLPTQTRRNESSETMH